MKMVLFTYICILQVTVNLSRTFYCTYINWVFRQFLCILQSYIRKLVDKFLRIFKEFVSKALQAWGALGLYLKPLGLRNDHRTKMIMSSKV